MKKTKKLNLNTEKIRNLSDGETKRAAGGITYGTCASDAQACGTSQVEGCTNYTYFSVCTYPTQGFC